MSERTDPPEPLMLDPADVDRVKIYLDRIGWDPEWDPRLIIETLEALRRIDDKLARLLEFASYFRGRWG
jgi:hypothetical protein